MDPFVTVYSAGANNYRRQYIKIGSNCTQFLQDLQNEVGGQPDKDILNIYLEFDIEATQDSKSFTYQRMWFPVFPSDRLLTFDSWKEELRFLKSLIDEEVAKATKTGQVSTRVKFAAFTVV
jgi:hypothetical protein